MSITTLHLDDAGKTGATINNHHFHHETQFLKNKTENNPKNKTNKNYPESQIWKMIQRTHQIFKLCYKKKKNQKDFTKNIKQNNESEFSETNNTLTEILRSLWGLLNCLTLFFTIFFVSNGTAIFAYLSERFPQ